MTNSSFNLSADLSLEKFYSATKLSKQNHVEQKEQENIIKQDPNTTGVQWAYTQAPANLQSAQNINQTEISQKQANTQIKDAKIELKAPDIEDTAILSTQVSIKDEKIESLTQRNFNNYLASQFNLEALIESYKENFKKSKSHNLLLARFMAHCKFSAVKMLISMLGVSAEEQIRIQEEVRKEALKEIDAKLSQDWAYTKAMIEITG